MSRLYHVYILSSHSGTYYIGCTSDLKRRLWQHRTGHFAGFTKQYCVHKLLYAEAHSDPRIAAARERQLKGWVRRKKEALIRSINPHFDDLAAGLQPERERKDESLPATSSHPS